jgi:hypothetical protein
MWMMGKGVQVAWAMDMTACQLARKVTAMEEHVLQLTLLDSL